MRICAYNVNKNMKTESFVRLLAGTLVLLGVALTRFVNPWWLLLPAFVGANLAVALKTAFAELKVTAFDNLKRRGSELNLPRLREHGRAVATGGLQRTADRFDPGSQRRSDGLTIAGRRGSINRGSRWLHMVSPQRYPSRDTPLALERDVVVEILFTARGRRSR